MQWLQHMLKYILMNKKKMWEFIDILFIRNNLEHIE